MVLFSYLLLLLSHPLINKRSGSEEGCTHNFLLNFHPSYPLQMYVHLPLPLLHIHFSPHIRIKLHPSLCIILFPHFYPRSLPLHLRIPFSRDLRIPLHLHLRLPLFLDLCTTIHLHLCLLSFSLPRYFPLHIPIPHDVCPPLNLHLHLHLPHLPFTLFIPLPLCLRSSYLHIPHYHLHPNHTSQIIQWLASLMPIFTYLCYEIVE